MSTRIPASLIFSFLTGQQQATFCLCHSRLKTLRTAHASPTFFPMDNRGSWPPANGFSATPTSLGATSLSGPGLLSPHNLILGPHYCPRCGTAGFSKLSNFVILSELSSADVESPTHSPPHAPATPTNSGHSEGIRTHALGIEGRNSDLSSFQSIRVALSPVGRDRQDHYRVPQRGL
ncbi:hypothetical protein BC826DRAFT_624913 [Russula brevipes]|nr:hypothetical protein BC826DRAFT_624913 [Russula brevipes]